MIFHVDANSAYLSWTASWLLEKGASIDLRDLPSVIGGSAETRHGIVLAKSGPAKKAGIKTGESLYEARQKCPDLLVYPPDYQLYMLVSSAMVDILKEYGERLQRYSIDECFLEYEGDREDSLLIAHKIKERIKKELGFTVNIGISESMILAKMASSLKKPDLIHTIFKEEIREKMWPLPVRDLFMVGRATELRLKRYGIRTIGDLAVCDLVWIKAILKSHGILVRDYANGIDRGELLENKDFIQKSLGNSLTIPYDVKEEEDAEAYLLGLSEQVGLRLRRLKARGSLLSVKGKSCDFVSFSHQRQLLFYTDSTQLIYDISKGLLKEIWDGKPLRQLGLTIGNFDEKTLCQMTFWEDERSRRLDQAVDEIRARYGKTSLIRGRFANGLHKPFVGGVGDGTEDNDYIMMGGYGG